MNKYQPILSFFTLLLVFCLAGIGFIGIWSPDVINPEIFPKLFGTFAVLACVGVVVIFLGSLGQKKNTDDK